MTLHRNWSGLSEFVEVVGRVDVAGDGDGGAGDGEDRVGVFAGEFAESGVAEWGMDVLCERSGEDEGVASTVVVFGDDEVSGAGLERGDATVDVGGGESWLVGGDDEESVGGGGCVLVGDGGDGEADGVDHFGLIVVVDDDGRVLRFGE